MAYTAEIVTLYCIQLYTFDEVCQWPWRPASGIWLTDAVGICQPKLDKVFMVMSKPKSKVYYMYCLIELFGIRLTHVSIITAFLSHSVEASLAQLKIETLNTPQKVDFGVLTLRYMPVNAVLAHQRRAKEGEIPDHF